MKTLMIALTSMGVFAACSNNATDNPVATSDQYNDVAQIVGNLLVTGSDGDGDVAAMANALAAATGNLPTGFAAAANGNVDGARTGIKYDYALSCDSAGSGGASCGSSTATATADLTWSGAINETAFIATTYGDSAWSLSDLSQATEQLSGTGATEIDATVTSSDGTNGYHFDTTDTYSAIAIDSSTMLPTGGTISSTIAGGQIVENGLEVFDVDAVITFESGGTAKIVLDGTNLYTEDLTSGLVTGAAGSD